MGPRGPCTTLSVVAVVRSDRSKPDISRRARAVTRLWSLIFWLVRATATATRWFSRSTSRSARAWLCMTAGFAPPIIRSEEHTSELQSLMRISYAVFCLKKKKIQQQPQPVITTTHYTNKQTHNQQKT